MDGKAVWAASGSDVIRYLRGKEIARLSNPLGSTLSFFLIFGTQLLALTEDGRRMLVWDIAGNGQWPNRSSNIYIADAIVSLAVYH
jgi:U3 small nucleolar RNA-associated protein 21